MSAPEEDRRIGTDIGGYRIQRVVADGAMGRVYQSERVADGVVTAVKVLHANVAQDRVAVERFKREFETATEVAHPHVVRVYDFGGTKDGSYYIAMEYLTGEELGEQLRREGALALPRAVKILCQVAHALDHAHSFGVIHRDLKPDNIFLATAASGGLEVRLLDFGAVKLQMETGPKLTAFGMTIGSPYYMSPEQAMGKQDVDQRTDVFALSAILYEMATGEVAFGGDNVAQILMKIVHEPTPLPSLTHGAVPAALDEIVSRGCAKDKADRYPSAGALAEACLTALGLSGGSARWAHATEAEVAEALSATAGVGTVPDQPIHHGTPMKGAGAIEGRSPSGAPSGLASGRPYRASSMPSLPRTSGPVLVLVLGLVGLGLAALAAVVALALLL